MSATITEQPRGETLRDAFSETDPAPVTIAILSFSLMFRSSHQ